MRTSFLAKVLIPRDFLLYNEPEMKPEEHEKALENIDQGIKDAAEITIEASLAEAVRTKRMTQKEAEECLAAYERTFHPITDDDTLASPIGYYEEPRSIYE